MRRGEDQLALVFCDDTMCSCCALVRLGMFAPAVYIPFATMILERVFRKYMAPEDLEAEKEIDMYRKR